MCNDSRFYWVDLRGLLLLLLIWIGLVPSIKAQPPDSIKFDHNVEFTRGVYTKPEQLLTNSPKYSNCAYSPNVMSKKGKQGGILFYSSGEKRMFRDTLFAFIEKGDLLVFHDRRFYELSTKGAISLFDQETKHLYHTELEPESFVVYYLDVLTGKMGVVTRANIEEILVRDEELHTQYSTLPKSQKKKLYKSYIQKYNARNPIYIKKKG